MNADASTHALAVLTSGGDAPGMNAAVRSVVRCALNQGVKVFAVLEGYQGMVAGGAFIRPMAWADVGGILQHGGTVIGTARSDAFRTRAGRKQAAAHLVDHAIDSLVVIGGDGSLRGADALREEWPGFLAELAAEGRIDAAAAERHAKLTIVGLVGSIDNDMQGTDTTIGADTALHRITAAIDAIMSTAASHQRTFVVEVMGRHCGYLALMSALATGAGWVLIPESPPDVDDWESEMCRRLAAGREAGRRDSVVVIAEGATDRRGNPISASYVKSVLEERLGEGVRETILGHVQRGGSPSAFDRNQGTILGHAAVETALDPARRGEASLLGFEENRVTRKELMPCVEETDAVATALKACDYDAVMELRGPGFRAAYRTLRTVVRAHPHAPEPGRCRLRLGIVNAGAAAPGMNMATRIAVRLGIDRGHQMLGVRGGFDGLVEDRLDTLDWMDVNGWGARGGSELGTKRKVPSEGEFAAIAQTIEARELDGLLVIGGYSGYEAAQTLWAHRATFPALARPLLCLPASIDNNVPGSEISVGADTALNSIISAVDAIKQSAVASGRAFVVEVMGHTCGYLALMSGLATGAERVYLNEEGVTLEDLRDDVQKLIDGFQAGKRLGLMIRNECANAVYDTDFCTKLFEEAGGDLFEVRKAILGHLQQGGNPTPFDRVRAAGLASRCIEWLDDLGCRGDAAAGAIGVERGRIVFHDLEALGATVDPSKRRPLEQWWMALRPVARILAQPGPHYGAHS